MLRRWGYIVLAYPKQKGRVMKRAIFIVGLFLCLFFVCTCCYGYGAMAFYNECPPCSSIKITITVPATPDGASYIEELTLGGYHSSVAYELPHGGYYYIESYCLEGIEYSWTDYDYFSTVGGTSSFFYSCSSPTTTSTSQITTTIFPEYYSISGRMTGDIFAGVSMNLTGTDSRTLKTDINGYFLFNLLDSGYYTITPAYEGYVFQPQNHVIQSLTDDLSGIDFVSTRIRTPCPAIQIYREHSTETELLRSLRDNVLSKSQEGRELIKLYYRWSPAIVKAMEGDEEFKEEVKEIIDEVLEMMRGVVEEPMQQPLSTRWTSTCRKY
jgi:hypothetical protein